MRFQSVSLVVPSSNVAGAEPATPSDFCFPCNVKYDYTPSGGGTIIDPITPPAPTGSTLTVGTGQTYATIAAALAAANNGDRLLLTAETFTLSAAVTVNKQITIQGASRAGTLIQSAGTGTDPVTLLTVQTSNFVIRDCTVKHRKTTNTSVETAISVIGFSNTSPLATATGGSTTTMTVAGTPWLTNQWVGAKVTFTTGANAGLSRIVSSNTNNTLTFPALPNAVVSGNTYAVIPMNVYFENVAVENVEFAIVLRCDNWQINNCHLAYVGPNNSTRRLIGVYRSDGQGLFTNSTYNSGQNGVITGNTRVFNVLSTVGLPIETLGGYLRLGYITSANSYPMQQFFNCEQFIPGATPLTFCVDNCNTKANGSSGETSAFVVWTQTQPTLSQCAQVNLKNNTLSNVHGKGAFALNGASGTGTPGSTTFYASGNTITSTAFVAPFVTGITGSVVPAVLAQLGYDTARWSNPNQSITVPAGLNGLFTVDGVALQDGYRVFVVDSSNAVTSGIYSANAGAWYRTSDLATGDDAAGVRFSVEQGTTYAGTNWLCANSPGNGIVGTNALSFSQTDVGPPAYTTATGGTITEQTIGGVLYRIHTFTSSGTFTVTGAGQVEYLIVGGGGAGGPGLVSPQRPGCGGNAGQMLTGSTTVTVQAYAITIGAGGVGASDTSGSASSALGLTATGGSIGASQNGPYAGTGASGGVNGLQSSINGSSTYYGGGGGAAQFPPGNVAGLGGGGTGATPDSLGNGGQSGTANTGGGGGGGYGRSDPPASRRSGGDGGSGVVILRYQIG